MCTCVFVVHCDLCMAPCGRHGWLEIIEEYRISQNQSNTNANKWVKPPGTTGAEQGFTEGGGGADVLHGQKPQQWRGQIIRGGGSK